jgi:hypothetical protein
MNKKSSSSTTVVVSTGRPKSNVTVAKPQRPRKARKRVQRTTPGVDLLRDYVNTLRDPFEHGAVKLGWGCYSPTELATLWYRGSFTTNATDGSFAVMIMPTGSGSGSVGPIATNAGGINTSTWAATAWSNLTPVQNMLNAARIVSVGVKCYPQVAATSAPGFVYSGCIPNSSYTAAAALTPNQYSQQPYLKFGQGSCGAIATGRPVDPTSYEFYTTLVSATGYPVGTSLPFTIPIVVFTGLPVASTVLVEAVLNLEGLPDQQTSTVALEMTGEGGYDSSSPTLADAFPNMESMMRSVKASVGPTGTIDSISNLISRGSSAAIRAAAHGVGTAFSGGARHLASAAANGLLQSARESYFDGMGRGRTLGH